MANESEGSEMISVEVAYALPDRQKILALKVQQGCTALEAARQSGIVREFPEIDLDNADMGIFARNLDGKMLPTPAEYVMKERDRVEIYRPLLADPKAARKERAAKAKARKEESTDENDSPDS